MAKEETKEQSAEQQQKEKALKSVLDKIEKTFGKGSIMNMASQEIEDIEVIPTGSLNLDIALGVGGYPKGRIVEIYGPESSGKTTLAIHAIAECQKQGGFAAIIAINPEIDISDLERVRGYDVMKIMRIGRDFISGKSEEPYTPDSSDAQSETTPEPSTRRRETSESEG